jgi:hypothetical protein
MLYFRACICYQGLRHINAFHNVWVTFPRGHIDDAIFTRLLQNTIAHVMDFPVPTSLLTLSRSRTGGQVASPFRLLTQLGVTRCVQACHIHRGIPFNNTCSFHKGNHTMKLVYRVEYSAKYLGY